jgi:hypothetical protein
MFILFFIKLVKLKISLTSKKAKCVFILGWRKCIFFVWIWSNLKFLGFSKNEKCSFFKPREHLWKKNIPYTEKKMYSICTHERRTNYEFQNSTASAGMNHKLITNFRIAQRLQTYERTNGELNRWTEHNCSLSSLVFRSIREGMQAVFFNWGLV